MGGKPNHFYKVEIILRDTSDDTDAIAEDIAFLLGGYDLYEMSIYEVTH